MANDETLLLTISDTTTSGKIINQLKVSLKQNRVTVKDLIEALVTAEVEKYNDQLSEYFTGLVQPTDAEKTLNGYRMKVRKKVDAEKQVYIALESFTKNGFFLLIDNLQAESLHQQISISPNTQVSFIKLTPLVGG